MAKFSRQSKLSAADQRALLVEFCDALVALKTREEAADFLQDLLSKQEVEMLARRIQIARMLLDGKEYPEIQKALKVGSNTIARVSEWLQIAGKGFRLVKERTKPYIETKADPLRRAQDMRYRYKSYYWPELLAEALIQRSEKKRREKLNKILHNLNAKSRLYKQIQNLLSR